VTDDEAREPGRVGGGGPMSATAGDSPPDARPLIPDGLDASLLLLRHGETEWIVDGRFQGQSETPLSPLGRRQADLAGGRIARPHAAPALPVPLGPPLEIIHSPLARTAETASIVAARIASPDPGKPDPSVRDPAVATSARVDLRPEPGFREIGQGDWEGETHDEIRRRWGDVLAAWRRSPTETWAPGGESLAEVQARIRPAIAVLLERLGRGSSRGSLDRPQVPGFRGERPHPDHPWSVLVGHDGVFKVVLLTLFDLPLERFWTFPFALCGITVVEFLGGRAVLRAHNLTEHLAPLLDERAAALADARARSGAL
jgi:broad specificity phosphatase PhoE